MATVDLKRMRSVRTVSQLRSQNISARRNSPVYDCTRCLELESKQASTIACLILGSSAADSSSLGGADESSPSGHVRRSRGRTSSE